MIKNPLTTSEKLQAYGAMSMVSYEWAPHAKGARSLESVQLKLLKHAKVLSHKSHFIVSLDADRSGLPLGLPLASSTILASRVLDTSQVSL